MAKHIWLACLLTVAQAFAAGPPVLYDECKDLTGGALDVCQSEVFARKRLIADSTEDQYAQRAGGYRTPNAEGDSRSGSSLETCGVQKSTCVKNCEGKGDCIQKCHMDLLSCAGTGPGGVLTTASGAGPAPTVAERPDTYIIDFDDNVNKKQ